MIGASGALARTLATSAVTGADAPAFEFSRRQHPGPRIEDLHRFRPSRQLAHEIFGGGVDEALDQRGEQAWMAIGEQARGRLIGRAAPGDHVARDRPGRAAKADQRDIVGEFGFHPVERLEHGRELLPVGLGAEPREAGRVLDRSEPRPLAALEGDLLPERVRDDENVGEQDCRVEAEAADRLQRRLDRQGGRVAEVEKGCGAGAHFAVFGQIAPRLAHEPDRRRWLPLARERGEKGLARFVRSHACWRPVRRPFSPCGDKVARSAG